MEFDKSLHLSLTKKDIDYLLNKKEITKKAIIWNVVFNVIKIVIGACLGVVGVLGHMGMLALLDLVPLVSGFVAFMLPFLALEISSKDNKKFCDAVLERIKLIAQQHCPERLIDGATFKVVRSSNVKNNLNNYTFEQQVIHSTGDKLVDKVVREDLQIGTISTQFVISDKTGVIGAIEEVQTNDIERTPTYNGSCESVVSTYCYKWVPTSEIRTPYEDADIADKFKPKGKSKARKPNNS